MWKRVVQWTPICKEVSVRLSVLIVSWFCLLFVTLAAQVLYFTHSRSLNEKNLTCKKSFVSLVGLPDLALVSEAHFIRHRSLSDTFAPFSDGPELLEYFPSTFVYHAASLPFPSKITHAN
jgi:hypothetical protein